MGGGEAENFGDEGVGEDCGEDGGAGVCLGAGDEVVEAGLATADGLGGGYVG